MGASCTLPVLNELTRDPVPFVRYSAAAAMLDLRDDRGLDVLFKEALVHQNPNVRKRALEAISAFAGEDLTTRDQAVRWRNRR